MFFGFDIIKGECCEVTPFIFRSLNKTDRQLAFLNQYNSCVEENLRIPTNLAYTNMNLREIFDYKINSLLNVNNLNKTKILSFCVYSLKIIEAYKQKKFDKIPFENNIPLHDGAKLIQMIYAKNEQGLKFYSSELFSQFVFNKISLRHLDKNIYLKNDIIIVEKDGKKLLGVLPSFKHIISSKPYLAQAEINKALNELKDESLPMLFLVFPRNKNFKKHIEVKICGECNLQSRLKLVPYAISNKIIYQRRH